MVNQARVSHFKMQKSQFINYMAISLLEVTGNKRPTQAEIDATENLILTYLKYPK